MDAHDPIVRELRVPGIVLRRLAVLQPDRYPVLLDSAAEGPLSRTSILAAYPRAALWLDAQNRLGAEGMTPRASRFLEALEQWWLAERASPAALGLPFTGGWILFLAYEMACEIEPRLALPASENLPWRAFALRTPCALLHERATDRVFAVAEPDAVDELEQMLADVRRAERHGSALDGEVHALTVSEEPPEAYVERIHRVKEYIRAGDIYRANIARSWQVRLEPGASIGPVYRRLCDANPAPFAALAQWQGTAILSSSPERLVRLTRGRIETRPIAGTRPRSRRHGGDANETVELAAHPKERAEHVMLIDLERNDLGRVCEPGTVRVDELMTIESYAHVHHIVSNVSGRLRNDVTPIGALQAVFPGGTITGCPKFRCMQIIAELEGVGRGAYTGSLGFLGRDGSMDLNILIRTMTVTGDRVELRAGAGIVADSDPLRELEETRAKARGMLAVFESAATPGAAA